MIPACGNCFFARELRNGHPAKGSGALACWGTPPQLIVAGSRKVQGIRMGSIMEPDRVEPIFQTENVPVLPNRPACALWQCTSCGTAMIFLKSEHVCPGKQEGETAQ